MEATRRSMRQEDRRRQVSASHEDEEEVVSGNEEESFTPPKKRGRTSAVAVKKDHDFGTEPSPDPEGLRKKGPEYVGSTKIKTVEKTSRGEEPEENGVVEYETDPNASALDETEQSEFQTTAESREIDEAEIEQEDGVVGFTSESLSFDNVERLLLHADDIPKSKICTTVPSGRRAFLGNISYVVDLDALPTDNDIRVDNMGKWGTPSGRNRYYIYKDDGTPSRMFFKDGKPPPANVKFDVKICRNFYRNQASGNKLYKKIFKSSNSQGETLRYAVIAYEWATGGPFHFNIGYQSARRVSSRGRVGGPYQSPASARKSAYDSSMSGSVPRSAPKINVRGAGRTQRLFGRPRSPRPTSPPTFGGPEYDSMMDSTADMSADYSTGTGMTSFGLGGGPRKYLATEHDPLLAQKRELIRQQSANAKLMNTVLMKTNKLLDKFSRAPVMDSLNGLMGILSQMSIPVATSTGTVIAEGGVMPEEGANVVVHEDGEVVQYQYA